MKKGMVIIVLFFTAFLAVQNSHANDKALLIGVIQWRGPTPVDQTFISDIQKQFKNVKILQENSSQQIRTTANILQVEWASQLKQMDYIFSFGSRNSLKVRELLLQSDFKGTLIAFANTEDLVRAFYLRAENSEKLILARPIIQPSSVLETFRPLTKSKVIGVPFNAFEPQSKELLPQLQDLSNRLNLKIIPIRTRPHKTTFIKQIQLVLDKEKEIDLLMFLQDSFMISQSEKISELCLKKGLLCIGANAKYTQDGFPLAIAVDYADMGRSIAKQIAKIENGTPLFSLPIIYGRENQIYANRAALLNVAPNLLKVLPQTTKFVD